MLAPAAHGNRETYVTYHEPRATVLTVELTAGVWRIMIHLDHTPGRPVAPASLCRDDDPAITLAELHRLVRYNGPAGVRLGGGGDAV